MLAGDTHLNEFLGLDCMLHTHVDPVQYTYPRGYTEGSRQLKPLSASSTHCQEPPKVPSTTEIRHVAKWIRIICGTTPSLLGASFGLLHLFISVFIRSDSDVQIDQADGSLRQPHNAIRHPDLRKVVVGAHIPGPQVRSGFPLAVDWQPGRGDLRDGTTEVHGVRLLMLVRGDGACEKRPVQVCGTSSDSV